MGWETDKLFGLNITWKDAVDKYGVEGAQKMQQDSLSTYNQNNSGTGDDQAHMAKFGDLSNLAPVQQHSSSGGGGGSAPQSASMADMGPAPDAYNTPSLQPVRNEQQYQSSVNEFKGWLKNYLAQDAPDVPLPAGLTQEKLMGWLEAEPAQFKVTPEMTSQYQLNKMLASGSPLMAQADYMGRASAAQRGLLNTSMAGGAAQAAMIGAATPYAQQDAQTYQTAALANMQAQNQRIENLRGVAAALQQSDQVYKQNWNLFEQQLEGKAILAEQGYGYDMALQELQGNIASSLQRQGYTESAALAEQQYLYAWELAKQGFGFDMDLLKTKIAGEIEIANLNNQAMIDRLQWEFDHNPNIAPPVRDYLNNQVSYYTGLSQNAPTNTAIALDTVSRYNTASGLYDNGTYRFKSPTTV